ncbi:F0F1 ATP synthase subunit B [Salipaludibacillus aurantiacus]|uniref:ATP synthase subunit b n=1 Tax=Salipaludibacillus aurantiacus TaxID=1601833 RepID=A0A1H9VCL9_9BACI|nr:F0F1 ATP synthase subunit B [Salipaludibacillus aurantiacus]SES19540.1 F-type H+-transporting ATPase subunit b [Salipaludibacillus aurantiacus]
MFDVTEIEWINAIYQILAFGVLLLLLKKFAFGPIMDMMEKREQHVADQISSAEKNREESEKFLAEQREAIQEARQEAKEIVENSKKMSDQQADEVLENARKEAERMKQNALAEINTEKEQAISALREQVSTLSVLVASKVIEKELDEKEQEKLIQDTLKEVGEDL